jgi:hypothetical protein
MASRDVAPIKVPINLGEAPDYETQINYPKLFNMFVGGSGSIYTDPGLSKLSENAPDDNARALHYSRYRGGRYFFVTDDQFIEISLDGSVYTVIADIKNTGQAVQIVENDQFQIGFVDGRNAYVYSQGDTPVFTRLSSVQGFNLLSPISITVLNNIAAVLDRETNSWIISDPNNMMSWPVLDYVATLDSALTQGLSLKTLNNNLYIFGTTGIERWVPNTGNNPYLFPFDKDTSYRQEFGGISTKGIVNGFERIYFLSSKYVPMELTVVGLNELSDESYKAGLAKILSDYPDVTKCEASFYSFKGNYFFAMTFRETGICWRYCVNSQTYSTGDDLIISALTTYQVVATSSGVYNLTLLPQKKKRRTFVSSTIKYYKGANPNRTNLSYVDLQMVQGAFHVDPEFIELTISLDGQKTWTNTIKRRIGRTAERNSQCIWNMNIAAKQFVFMISYYGQLDFTIENIYSKFT